MGAGMAIAGGSCCTASAGLIPFAAVAVADHGIKDLLVHGGFNDKKRQLGKKHYGC